MALDLNLVKFFGDFLNLANLLWVFNVPGASGAKTPTVADIFRRYMEGEGGHNNDYNETKKNR